MQSCSLTSIHYCAPQSPSPSPSFPPQIKPAMYRDLEASKDIILKSWYPNVEVQWNTGE